MIHTTAHPLAGETVKVNLAGISDPPIGPFRVEDWWDRVSNGTWGTADGNPAALAYAMRAGFSGLPLDDEVVYGKDDRGRGHIVHVTELVEPSAEVPE